jgi:hypothetical protein
MKRSEAIGDIAEALKEQHRNLIRKAEMALGNKGKIVPQEIDYRKQAEEVLDGIIVQMAYERVMNNISTHHQPYAVPACPPSPSGWGK